MVSKKNKTKSAVRSALRTHVEAPKKRSKKNVSSVLSKAPLHMTSLLQKNLETATLQLRKELKRKFYSSATYVGHRMEKIGYQIQKNGYPMAGRAIVKIGHAVEYLNDRTGPIDNRA
jgi:hypothetical protein